MSRITSAWFFPVISAISKLDMVFTGSPGPVETIVACITAVGLASTSSGFSHLRSVSVGTRGSTNSQTAFSKSMKYCRTWRPRSVRSIIAMCLAHSIETA
jgi:hypothetical protein